MITPLWSHSRHSTFQESLTIPDLSVCIQLIFKVLLWLDPSCLYYSSINILSDSVAHTCLGTFKEIWSNCVRECMDNRNENWGKHFHILPPPPLVPGKFSLICPRLPVKQVLPSNKPHVTRVNGKENVMWARRRQVLFQSLAGLFFFMTWQNLANLQCTLVVGA